MAVLFISLSSKDDVLANSLANWLNKHGFTDIFMDHDGIAAGDKWRDELRSSTSACRVMILLVTPNWLQSDQCFSEFRTAWLQGKRLIPLFLIADIGDLKLRARQRLGSVRREDQGLDLNSCIGHDGLLNIEQDPSVAKRLKTGLRAGGAIMRVGLDLGAFEIDRAVRNMPFPGLVSFGDEDADAALLYGRSREITCVLEDLREMRAKRDHRALAIQGASGAGKSSLLKAGIIPRLRREKPAWLPLRAFRPGANPLLNFAEAIARTAADYGQSEAHGIIRDRLYDAWSKGSQDTASSRAEIIGAIIEEEGKRLRSLADRLEATILISID